MLSQQAAENLCASFSGPALGLVISCLDKGSGNLLGHILLNLVHLLLLYNFNHLKYLGLCSCLTNACHIHRPLVLGKSALTGTLDFTMKGFWPWKVEQEKALVIECLFMMDEIAI